MEKGNFWWKRIPTVFKLITEVNLFSWNFFITWETSTVEITSHVFTFHNIMVMLDLQHRDVLFFFPYPFYDLKNMSHFMIYTFSFSSNATFWLFMLFVLLNFLSIVSYFYVAFIEVMRWCLTGWMRLFWSFRCWSGKPESYCLECHWEWRPGCYLYHICTPYPYHFPPQEMHGLAAQDSLNPAYYDDKKTHLNTLLAEAVRVVLC